MHITKLSLFIHGYCQRVICLLSLKCRRTLCQHCNLAVQRTTNQSEDQVVSDDEYIVEDPELVPKPSLINCLEALVTLRSYFHYEGTEYDEDMERIEKVLRKKAEMKNQTAITDYFR